MAVTSPPRTQTTPLRVLNGGERSTSGVETLEVISPELALVDPELAARARSSLPTYDSDELVVGPQGTSHINEIAPEPWDAGETVLSPELALVDPELADWARARLAIVEADSPATPVGQPGQPPLHPSQVPPRADREHTVELTRRARNKRSLIVAVVALALALGGAAATWARYDDGGSGSRVLEQATFQPPRQRSSRGSKQGIAVQRHARSAPRSARRGAGSAPRSGARARTLRHPRPAAFHVPGAPREPLDEIPLPARALRLSAWLTPSRRPTAANQRHWLYQHAWIVTGARFGWWHGANALRLLIRVDRRIEYQWGIGYRSEAVARTALGAVEASAK